MSVPQLSVITGPVNSGLMYEVLSKLPSVSTLHSPILHLNLRMGTYTSVDSLVHSFAEKIPSWMDKIYKIAKLMATLKEGVLWTCTF